MWQAKRLNNDAVRVGKSAKTGQVLNSKTGSPRLKTIQLGKGTDGDFHRGKDEDAAILAAQLAVKNDERSIPSLISQCLSINDITKQENFWRKLRKLGGLDVIKTTNGLDLVEAIKKGAVIYIVGSTENERVKMLQKMLLIRIMQIVKKQDRSKITATTCCILDEFKHLLSPTATTGLGVIRDFQAHFLLSHQSLGDLDSCAGITRAEAGAVLDNTAIKIIYKLGDAGHAEKLSKISGKRSIFTEQVNKSLGDNNANAGGWRESHIPLIDTDMLTHLPMPSDRENQPSTGALFGVGKAKIFHVHHIKATIDMPILPTQDMADRLHLLITSIKSVKVAGQKVQIDPEKHHVNIHFCSYANWPRCL